MINNSICFSTSKFTEWQHEIPIYLYRKGKKRLKDSMKPSFFGALFYLVKNLLSK